MPGVWLLHYDDGSEPSRYATIKWKRYFLYHLYPFCVLVLGTNGHKSDQWKFRFFLYGRSEQDGVLSGLDS